MKHATFEGGCLCGAIRYRVTAAPVRGVFCHCADCRRQSGAPVLSFVLFPAGAFDWVSGEPTYYRSSDTARRGFCPRCGSTLEMHEAAMPAFVQVTLGSLDDPGRVRMNDHVWAHSRLPWFHIDDDLPRYPKASPADPAHGGP